MFRLRNQVAKSHLARSFSTSTAPPPSNGISFPVAGVLSVGVLGGAWYLGTAREQAAEQKFSGLQGRYMSLKSAAEENEKLLKHTESMLATCIKSKQTAAGQLDDACGTLGQIGELVKQAQERQLESSPADADVCPVQHMEASA